MAKAQLLKQLRQRLGVNEDDLTRKQSINSRLQAHLPNTVPAFTQQAHAQLMDMFEQKITAAKATLTRIASPAEIVPEVARYLGTDEAKLCLNPEIESLKLDFSNYAHLKLTPWTPKASLDVSVSTCYGAVAETGSLVIVSSKHNSITQNFLGEKYIVLLDANNIVGAYEEIWNKVRSSGDMPRDLTLVSGPSCTGDIEMTMEYGAHGPRQLHVIVIAAN